MLVNNVILYLNNVLTYKSRKMKIILADLKCNFDS